MRAFLGTVLMTVSFVFLSYGASAQVKILGVRPIPEILEDCVACHSFNKADGHKLGPNLDDVFGRPIASAPGYDYSDALLSMKDGVWTRSTLMGMLERPDFFAGATHMNFKGLANFSERRRLILWLEEQSVEDGSKAPTASPTIEDILSKGDAVRGQSLTERCLLCHSVAAKQRRRRIGPSLYGIIGRAKKRGKAGAETEWTPVGLYQFFLKTEEFARGNHLTFRVLDTPRKRADLIAYLETLGEERDPERAPQTP